MIIDRAPKLSLTGCIEYRILNEDNEILFQMLENYGGYGKGNGTFSCEIITFSSVKSLLEGQSDRVIKTELLDSLFMEESKNNRGFFAAVLRHQGILAKEGNYHLIVHDALATWKDKLLGVGGESDSQH
jgi:hypothetical protein